MDNLEAINVCWVSDGQQVGDLMQAQLDQNGNKIMIWTGNNTSTPWVVPNTITIGDPPYNTPGTPWVPMPGPTYPGGGTTLPYPPPTIYPSPLSPLPMEEKDEKGNRVVKSPLPSLELILVEIAKVLRDGGDILGVREIFEKHKLKLIDHDGEIIFDPRKVEELEDKGF